MMYFNASKLWLHWIATIQLAVLALIGSGFVSNGFGALKFSTNGSIQDVEAELEKAVAAAVDSVSAAVIRLETIGGDGQVDGQKFTKGSGTAIVVDQNGYLLTASYFVADNPAGIIATLPNGKRVPAEIVARDRSRKLALLKIEAVDGLQVPRFAGRDKIAVGQTVVAVGRTIDAKTTQLSTGIVSATNRIWGKAIQTDAKISPANFGGPLLSIDGAVVGILVPMSTRSEGELAGTEWYDSGIGFAVPVNEVLERFETLKQGSDLHPGLLGVNFEGSDIYAGEAKVAFLLGSSPAGEAGVRIGDTIVGCNGKPVIRQAQLRHALGPLYAGDSVILTLANDSGTREVTAKLVKEIPPYRPVGIGVAAAMENGKISVRQLDPSGPAELAGMRVGDKILMANQRPVKDIPKLRMAVAAVAAGQPLALLVEREGEEETLELTVGDLSTEIPDEVRGLLVDAGDATVVNISVAEDVNECFAIVPPSSKANASLPSLLVWIPPSGKVEEAEALERWGDHCLKSNTIVLIPQSSDKQRWDSQEVDFVNRAVATLAKKNKFEKSRVVIGGTKSGATFASLVALTPGTQFRGLILDRGPVSSKIGEPKTSPVSPLMVLVAGEDQMQSMTSSLKKLRNSKFAIQSEPTISKVEMFRWLNLVDRF